VTRSSKVSSIASSTAARWLRGDRFGDGLPGRLDRGVGDRFPPAASGRPDQPGGKSRQSGVVGRDA
jgi:hypothetical protein